MTEALGVVRMNRQYQVDRKTVRGPLPTSL
jgi:hypothetical protein